MFDIITDSACDLTLDTTKQMGVEVVPFYVSLDGEHYRKEGKEITALHRRWLTITGNRYDPAKHRGIAELYVMDERFTAYYDKAVPGCAAFRAQTIGDTAHLYVGREPVSVMASFTEPFQDREYGYHFTRDTLPTW